MKIAPSILFGLAGLALQIQPADAQGSLAPPGPSGPTVLTLSQVEPRTPVDADHTPGNSGAQFAITSPGSYYLTTNIVGVSGEDGIDISANNVTLDLNGFSILGTNSGTLNFGVQILNGFANVTVHNGAISGWSGYGIYSLGNNVTLEHLSLSHNVYYGVEVVNLSAVRYCMTSGNLWAGIADEANGCLISDNVSSGDDSGNNPGYGGIVVVGSYNRIEDNQVTGAGVGAFGISVNLFGNSTNNIIVRNSVQGSGAKDYVFNSLQVVGPIITNAVTGIITNSNPWANFAF